jgi:dTDP-4-amino-4,6-dideoxygalactose transaminase
LRLQPTLDRRASEFLSLVSPRGRVPDQENLAKEFFSLQMFPELAKQEIEYVVRCVCEAARAAALVLTNL